MVPNRKNASFACLLGLSCCVTLPVYGQAISTGGATAKLGGGRSDNIFRTEMFQESRSFTLFGFESDYRREGGRLNLRADADVERRRYSGSEVDDETYGYADVSVEYGAVPDRVILVLTDQFSQGRIDPLEVSSPINRAELNELSFGSRFTLPFGERSSLRAELFRGNRSVSGFENFDGDSATATVSYVRALDDSTEVGVSFSDRDIDYDFSIDTFNTRSEYLSYRKTLSSGEAYLALGKSRSSSGTQRNSTPFIDLSWARDVGTRSRLELRAVQSYVDIFDDVRFGDEEGAVVGQGLYEQRRMSADFTVSGTRSSFSISFSLTEADYALDSGSSNDEDSFALSYRRALNPQTEFSVTFGMDEREFLADGGTDSRERWLWSLQRELGRQLALRLQYESNEDENVLGGTIDDDIVRLTMRWTLARSGDRPAL